jgi:hypothetical protein
MHHILKDFQSKTLIKRVVMLLLDFGTHSIQMCPGVVDVGPHGVNVKYVNPNNNAPKFINSNTFKSIKP